MTAIITNHVETLIESIRLRGDCTIPTLLEVLESHGVEVQGECVIHCQGRPNTLLWGGMSERARDAMLALQQDPRTIINAVSLLVFLLDGSPILRLPIAERPDRARDYTKQHWVPVTIDLTREARRRIDTPDRLRNDLPAIANDEEARHG